MAPKRELSIRWHCTTPGSTGQAQAARDKASWHLSSSENSCIVFLIENIHILN
jgi:hypothetical protein